MLTTCTWIVYWLIYGLVNSWKRIDMKIKNEAKEVSANERELLVKAFTLAPLGTAVSQ